MKALYPTYKVVPLVNSHHEYYESIVWPESDPYSCIKIRYDFWRYWLRYDTPEELVDRFNCPVKIFVVPPIDSYFYPRIFAYRADVYPLFGDVGFRVQLGAERIRDRVALSLFRFLHSVGALNTSFYRYATWKDIKMPFSVSGKL